MRLRVSLKVAIIINVTVHTYLYRLHPHSIKTVPYNALLYGDWHCCWSDGFSDDCCCNHYCCHSGTLLLQVRIKKAGWGGQGGG